MRNTFKKNSVIQVLLVSVFSKDDDSYSQPLGLGYLASYILKYYKRKINIKIVHDGYKKNILSILRYKPDIVGISTSSKNYGIAKKLAAFCKEREIITVIGGPHITSLPDSLDKNFDIGVIGEGEETFLEILQKFWNLRANLKGIKGIVYWEKNKLIFNKSRSVIKNLDKIPVPARNLLSINPNTPISLVTTRGCPYNCRFCSNKTLSKRMMRSFSVEYVINEIKGIIKCYHPYYIHIWDDNFVMDKERLKKIADSIILNGINKQVRFIVITRVDSIDDDVVKTLKKINTRYIALGFESGSNKILNYLKCGTTTVEQNINAIKTIKNYRIKIIGFFLIGSPMETKQTMLQTLNFIKRNQIDEVYVFILAPHPGTEVWNYAQERGLVSKDMKWSRLTKDLDKSYDYVYLCENLSLYEFNRFCKKFRRIMKIRKAKQMLLNAFLPERAIPFTRNIISEITGIMQVKRV